jgi:hypothetical protein
MNPARLGPHELQGLPTLTEVIELPPPGRDAATGSPAAAATVAPQEPAQEPVQDRVAEAPAAAAVDEAQLVERVLADLQRHADLTLELRLREALEPALARLADALLHDVRLEFAATLRDIVERAVTQELDRQRGRRVGLAID